MKRKRFKPEEIISKIRETEVELAKGNSVYDAGLFLSVFPVGLDPAGTHLATVEEVMTNRATHSQGRYAH